MQDVMDSSSTHTRVLMEKIPFLKALIASRLVYYWASVDALGLITVKEAKAWCNSFKKWVPEFTMENNED